jgi:hypothetical protein
MMTAANPVFPGMANTAESAILSATAEALERRNDALEQPDPPRKGQRVIIYPKDMWGLEEVLATGDPNADTEDGHEIAYQRVFAAAAQFEVTPTFLKEDSESILSDPKKAELVPQWMCLAERVATGSRPRVLEDGAYTPNSDDEAKEDVKADELTGMYTSEMDPNFGPKKLSSQEAARQRAMATALRNAERLTSSQSCFSISSSPEVSSDFGNSIVNSAQSSRQSSRQATPINSDNEDDMSYDQKRCANLGKKMASKGAKQQPPRCQSAPGTKAPSRQPAKTQQESEPKGYGTPASRMRDDAGPSQKVLQPSDSKAVAANERLQTSTL